jgi:hypothetical protein
VVVVVVGATAPLLLLEAQAVLRVAVVVAAAVGRTPRLAALVASAAWVPATS